MNRVGYDLNHNGVDINEGKGKMVEDYILTPTKTTGGSNGRSRNQNK